MHGAQHGRTLDNRCKVIPKCCLLFLRQLRQRFTRCLVGALSGCEHAAVLIDASILVNSGMHIIRDLGDAQNKVPIAAELLNLTFRQKLKGLRRPAVIMVAGGCCSAGHLLCSMASWLTNVITETVQTTRPAWVESDHSATQAPPHYSRNSAALSKKIALERDVA